MDEARNLISGIEAMIPDAHLNLFNWKLSDRDQGNFEITVMAFLWFNENVTPHKRSPGRAPFRFKGECVRATLETAPDKRP